MTDLTVAEHLILDAWRRGGPVAALRTGVSPERVREVVGKATEFGHVNGPFPSREEWEQAWAGRSSA